MRQQASQYPDISAIIADKSAGRRQRATLSFTEKLALLDDLKQRVAPIIQARELRAARKRRSPAPAAE